VFRYKVSVITTIASVPAILFRNIMSTPTPVFRRFDISLLVHIERELLKTDVYPPAGAASVRGRTRAGAAQDSSRVPVRATQP
jgi:hypothetical protein